jgi:hypothetical protein
VTDSIDMSAFIEARSDQLNADDLLDSPRTITITRVSGTGSAEQPVAVHYEGENGRPFMPCKTVRRIMVGAWGKYTDKYVGRAMTLYRDPAVSFGGMVVGGIRVSHMSHIDSEKTLALQVTRGRKAPFKILPLETKPQPASDLAVALKAITDAADEGLEALGNVWKQKWMAPHREALQIDLDRLKLVAAAKGASAEGNASASAGTAHSSDAGSSTENGSTTSDSGQTATTNASPSDAKPRTLGEQLGLDDPHPGEAKAAEILAEIGDCISPLDVTALVNRHKDDIAAMPDPLGVKIEVAADKRRKEIEAERAKAGATEAAE